ncbi:MAG: hypothetical protein AB7I41_01855 [Candidatus Sericytochromatia bacterium]
MKASLKYLSSTLLATLLASCSWIPPAQQSSKSPEQAQVQTVANTGTVKAPEKVTFPNMVTTTLLEAPEPSEVDEVSALLRAFLDNPSVDPGTGFSTASDKDKDDKHNEQDNNAAYVLEFKSKEAKGKRQILMPETGEFMLTLEAGPRFELLDKDARDGEARVQMPASTLKTWVHLEEAKDNSRLDVSDELYYVKDTLSKERKHKGHHDERDNKWFKLGLRPIPVPSDWYSPDGQAFVLRFKAKQIKEFELLLQKQRGEAPFPPGIKQIGPGGGVVELPGVAELEVPAGALTENKVIVIKQKDEVYQFPDEDFTPGPDEIDLATPVELQPSGLQFLKPANIRLKIDLEKAKGYLPSTIHYYLFPDNGIFWEQAEILHLAPQKKQAHYMTKHEWYEIHHFSFVRILVAPRTYSPSYIGNNEQEEFQIALVSEQPCPNPPINTHNDLTPQYILRWDVSPSEEKKNAACEVLLNSREDFIPYARGIMPSKWEDFRHGGTDFKGIPLYLKPITSGPGGATNGYTYAKGNGFRNAEMWVDPGPNIDNLIDSTAHENYHSFQVANVKSFDLPNQAFNPWGWALSTVDRAWLIESSGRFMGSISTFKHHELYKKYGIDPNPVVFLYGKIPYHGSLSKGLDLLNQTSLYQEPNIPDGENAYYRLIILNLISNFYPNQIAFQKIHDINVHYLQKREFTNEGAVSSLHNYAQLDTTFPNFGAKVALKDYGMGSEKPENFKYLERPKIRPIANNTGNLETVNYTIPAQPNDRANPILVTTRNTPNNPQMVTNSSLQNLQMAHRYVEFPLVTQKLSDKDPKKFKDPYMAYIYLDRASAEGLTDEQAEDFIAKGTRVLVLKNPKPLDNWKDEKPLLAKVKWLSDPKIVAEPLKFEKRINVPTESRNPSIKGVLPRSVYILGIPIPQEDRPTQNNPAEPHRVRLILSITNPYITTNSDKKTISFQFKAFVSPTIWGKRAFTESDGVTENKMLALWGSGFSLTDTVVYFKHRLANLPDIAVKAHSVSNLAQPVSIEQEQEIIVKVPDDAAPEEESYIYAKSGNLESEYKEKIELVCNMIPKGADYRITSAGNCKNH